MALRPYQQQAITDLREKLGLWFKKIFYQLPTGAGKTVIFTEITRLAFAKDLRVWIIVPRRKLLRQASNHLRKIKIPHGVISAKSNESRAFKVHVVSLQTLTRRIANGKIKNWPDIMIFDEGHTNLDQQVKIQNLAPPTTIFIGVSATPERADGRGLCEAYEDIIYGPEFSYLVECGYLSRIRYFCPPFDFKVKKRGDDYDPKTIEEILESRKIYGRVIQHYRENAIGKPTLVFCPSVKNAEETAQRFRDSGFGFESIDGRMSDGKLETILGAFEAGKLDGITSCDIVTYGLDIPSISNIIMLRKTMSRALFFQIIGRGTRPEDGKVLTVWDHVGNFRELATGTAAEDDPVEKCFDVEWNFNGLEKSKKKKGEVVASLKLCQKCYMYYSGTGSCPHCGTDREAKKIKYEEIDGRLIEIKGPIKLNEREPEERREIQDTIGAIKDRVQAGSIIDDDVKKMLDIAKDIGWNFMWVYWTLSEGMSVVNIPVLHSMRRALGYKQGWVWMQQKTIENRLGR
jgi:superfamily II DNA or RNA helicase